MKTRFHWWNIARAFIAVIITGILIGFLDLPYPISFFAGMVGGAAVMLVSLQIWDLFDFE